MRKEKRHVILHMSDMHFGIPERRQSAVSRNNMLNSFLKCYENLLKKHPDLAPDILVLSGDIAWSGSEADYAAAKDFFNRFLSVSGNRITPSQVVACFGNHDKCTDPYFRPVPGSMTASFDLHLGKYVKRPDKRIEGGPKERAPEDAYVLMPKDVEEYYHCFQHAEKFCNDMNFINLRLLSVKSQYKHAYGFCTVNGIEFIVLNTEWDFWGKEDKHAAGRLRLGLRLYQEAEQNTQKPFICGAPPRFVVFHRSLEHLHKLERPTRELSKSDVHVGNIIQLNDVTLNGHDHVHHIEKCGAHTEIMAGTIHSNDSREFSCNLIIIPAALRQGFNACTVRQFLYSPGNVYAPWHIENEGETFPIVRLKNDERVSDFLEAAASLSDTKQKQTGMKKIVELGSRLTPEEKAILTAILTEKEFRRTLEDAEKGKQTESPQAVHQTVAGPSGDRGPAPAADKDSGGAGQERIRDLTKTAMPKGPEKYEAPDEEEAPAEGNDRKRHEENGI